MGKVTCSMCGKKYDKLMQHVKVKHHMTKEEYIAAYPDSSSVSEEYSRRRSDILKSQWETEEFQQSVKSAASIQLKKLWEDPEYRERHVEMSRETMRKVSEESWNSPEFRQRARVRSSATMRKVNEIQWSNKDYRSTMSKRASIRLSSTLKELWKDPSYRKKMSIHSSKVLASQGRGVLSGPHKLVSEYLDTIGIDHQNEVFVRDLRVDIYIPSLDLVIEVNGEYFHGYHDSPLDSMTPLQLGGYLRDKRRLDAFGDRVLFLWDNKDIYTGDYVSIIGEYLERYSH